MGMKDIRFKPAYNPYTEPSMEIFAFHPMLNKYVEVGNSGVFRPEMLRTMGVPEDINVIAWGFGLERQTMIACGIKSIRSIFGPKTDLEFIKNTNYYLWKFYFADNNTEVHFISEEELKEKHSKMPHGGFVIRTGETGRDGNKHVIEYSLKLDSNPEFTSSVLVAYARAAYRLSQKGESGARSVFDIPPVMLSQKTPEQLRKEIL